MEAVYQSSLISLLSALLAGGLIGLERSYNGRPAGFRTHTLVCLASVLLMLLTVHQVQLLPDLPLETVRIDPTRMAQGIMTGIGFLGAGVIMKEGLTVRGLTTAASIWITASIGILIGIGFYSAAAAGTLIALGVLSLFRYIEVAIPTLSYGRLHVTTLCNDVLGEDALNEIILANDCSAGQPSYHLFDEGKQKEYRVTIRTRDKKNYGKLADALTINSKVSEYTLTPIAN